VVPEAETVVEPRRVTNVGRGLVIVSAAISLAVFAPIIFSMGWAPLRTKRITSAAATTGKTTLRTVVYSTTAPGEIADAQALHRPSANRTRDRPDRR
jgi:hypothetical protein